MREMVAGKYTRLRGRFEQLVERMQAAGHVEPDAPTGEVAQVLFGLMPGFIVQRLILGDVTPDSYAAGIEGELQRFIAKYVAREINAPKVVDARTINVGGAINRAAGGIVPS